MLFVKYSLIYSFSMNTCQFTLQITYFSQFRSTGMAVTLAFGRLGAILGQLTFGYLLDVNCAVPIIIVAALMISGGLTGLFVPNTTGIALD